MNKFQKTSLLLLRVSLGFLFLYAGISKFLTPNWTAVKYIQSSQTITPLYHWMASQPIINYVNLINEIGLTLIGLSLILGILVRLSSLFGILIMILYYLPILKFPYVENHALIVDEHIIYIFVFFLFFTFDTGNVWGFKSVLGKKLSKAKANK